MASPEYSLEGGNSTSARIRWILIALVVTLVTIAIIFVMSLSSKGSRETVSDDGQIEKTEAQSAGADSRQQEKSVQAPPRNNPPQEKLKEASADVRELIRKGQEAEAADDLVAARDLYLKALDDKDCGNARKVIEELLGNVNITLIFSPREMPEKIDHAIVSGDSLAKLAAKFNTPVDLIQASNGIKNPDRINPGDRIRLLNKPVFEISVGKKSNEMLVTMNGKFFKRYTVGTGRYNKTPVGTFKVKEKIKDPPWWKDGQVIPFGEKENILGTRWMEIEATGSTPPAKGYGIHGTWDNTSLGQQSSAGCIRMRNSDVEELFTYVPRGCAVIISE